MAKKTDYYDHEHMLLYLILSQQFSVLSFII